MYLAAISIAVLGALNVWVEPSTVRVFPDTEPRSLGAAREARLYAAGGEHESFQICVRAGDKTGGGQANAKRSRAAAPVEGLRVESEPLDAAIGAPDVRVVGYLALEAAPGHDERAAEPPRRPSLWPDPLLDPEPFSLTPGETRAFWVTYTVPAGAKPGRHTGKVVVTYGEGKRVTIPVNLNVFAFSLPETSTLRSALALDRKAIRAVYGISDTDLEAWKPFYDALSNERVSFRLWDGGDLVTVAGKETPPDTAPLKEHLEYAVPRAHMTAIDIGAGASGMALFGEPGEDELQDPIQFYLHDVCGWLQEKGWGEKAFVEAAAVGARDTWQPARDASFRIKRADKRIRRLLRGPVHPYFERYAELWATPLKAFDPYAAAALRDGHSLVDPNAASVRKVTASSSQDAQDGGEAPSPPSDACDGSLFSFWVSGGVPTRKTPEWLRVDFSLQVTSDRLKLVWRNGLEGDDVRPEFLIEGKWVEPTQLEWISYPASQPFAHSWAEVKWGEPYTFDALRLVFRSSFANRPVGVTEVTVGETQSKESPPDVGTPSDGAAGGAAANDGVQTEPWLCTAADCFPSFGVDAHPVEARIAPWICWGHRLSGLLHDGLNTWPEAWAAAAQTQSWVWPSSERGEAFLFYPGRKCLLPSIRSEALRDGMEDYEYLVLLSSALQRGEVNAPPLVRLCARRMYGPAPGGEDLQRMAAQVAKDRVAIGWALSEGKGVKPSHGDSGTPRPAKQSGKGR